MKYTRIYPAVQHQYLESPAPQDGLTNLPETPLSVDQFQLTKLPYPNVRPLILTLKAGFSSYLDLTTDQMTTILLKVMLLSQRTLDSSYPGVTQDTQRLLTRTVCLIGLSRFLLSSCTQDKFVMVLAPGHAHLPAINIPVYLDRFLASISFVTRHCASARNQICNRL